MTNHAKRAQPAKGTPPTSGWAPDYGFLLEANQRAFTRWLNGVNALSREIAQFTSSALSISETDHGFQMSELRRGDPRVYRSR